ncbi:predicted protein [Histoplasma capsulatum H143]|uniref:Uncharacterized protein n=1 Tax=Ajellomyces capsulatus (strain H143) TaxID=544712 RepID=C6HQV7_AJECH|nr:predicted protein [Histoplasma capsulatum H143]
MLDRFTTFGRNAAAEACIREVSVKLVNSKRGGEDEEGKGVKIVSNGQIGQDWREGEEGSRPCPSGRDRAWTKLDASTSDPKQWRDDGSESRDQDEGKEPKQGNETASNQTIIKILKERPRPGRGECLDWGEGASLGFGRQDPEQEKPMAGVGAETGRG